MKKERHYTRDNGDGLVLSAADWLMDFADRRPKVVIGVATAALILSFYGAKIESDRKERECLPPTSCHERIWKDSHPGEEYPFRKPFILIKL